MPTSAPDNENPQPSTRQSKLLMCAALLYVACFGLALSLSMLDAVEIPSEFPRRLRDWLDAALKLGWVEDILKARSVLFGIMAGVCVMIVVMTKYFDNWNPRDPALMIIDFIGAGSVLAVALSLTGGNQSLTIKVFTAALTTPIWIMACMALRNMYASTNSRIVRIYIHAIVWPSVLSVILIALAIFAVVIERWVQSLAASGESGIAVISLVIVGLVIAVAALAGLLAAALRGARRRG